jgi:hypothetical protein
VSHALKRYLARTHAHGRGRASPPLFLFSPPHLAAVIEQAHRLGLDEAKQPLGWQPVGTSGAFEYTRIDLSTGNF